MDKRKQTTVAIEPDFEISLKQEAAKLGIGWTTLLLMLAREGLAKRKAAQ